MRLCWPFSMCDPPGNDKRRLCAHANKSMYFDGTSNSFQLKSLRGETPGTGLCFSVCMREWCLFKGVTRRETGKEERDRGKTQCIDGPKK